MPWYIWLLIFDLAISGLITIGRSVFGIPRTYDWTDALGVVVAVPLYIWAIVHVTS